MRSHTLWQSALLAASLMGTTFAKDTGRVGNDYICTHPPYKPILVSVSPLVIYLEGFLSTRERSHLYAVSQGKFSHSAVTGSNDKQDGNTATRHVARTSQSAYVPRDAVLHCIEERAVAFQGYDIVREQLEPLQLVKYAPGEQYHFHTDWIARPAEQVVHAAASNGGNRLSSFFAYVHVGEDANGNATTGGGTSFPLLDAPKNEEWCRRGLVDCDAPWESGLTFRPVAGNAIFWRNLEPESVLSTNGAQEGDFRTLHAGLPIGTGEKIGLNIWTREGILSEDARGPEYYPNV
ncbi:hypothetical protein SEUCBS140593_007140 [Sporothrix eucalyptigena]|uniref:Fe2OG dioxygenase domain-containing protein n=1 Tax=Sporothrix eucalyptigena TaxID=1812306 RepID=A0ABP0CAR0_9PEZI